MVKPDNPKSQDDNDKISESEEQTEGIDKSEDESIFPDGIMDKFPPETRSIIQRSVSMSTFGATQSLAYHIAKKMTPEQVGSVIKHIENESQRDHEYRMSNSRWNFGYLIISLIFFIVLCALFLWKDKSEYIVPILTAIVGGAGGYGIGISKAQKHRAE